MIKRSPSLTDQVKENIKGRIVNNEFVDDRIPSETDLAEELGVSRTTVRDAFSRLEIEGVIYRKQGAGTFVNRPGLQIKSRLDEIWSYEAMLEAHGYTPSIKILTVDTIPAGNKLAAALNILEEETVLRIEKLFLENRQPVILVRNYIPVDLITRQYKKKDLKEPVFEFITRFTNQHLSYYLSELAPILSDAKLNEILRLSAPAPLISLEEVGYNELNEPILKASSFFRDDLLRLRLIRRKT
jgi:GntR family transcriptional regulator